MTKDKSKNTTTAGETGHFPTKERFRQNGGLVSESIMSDIGGIPVDRYRAVWECPLDAYRDRSVLTEPEYRAGLRFREAYHKAVLSRRATHDRLNRYPTSTSLSRSERLVRDAQQAVPPYNMGAVIDICGYDRPARDSAMLDKLKKGLGHLAVRWHMAAIEVCEQKAKST